MPTSWPSGSQVGYTRLGHLLADLNYTTEELMAEQTYVEHYTNFLATGSFKISQSLNIVDNKKIVVHDAYFVTETLAVNATLSCS